MALIHYIWTWFPVKWFWAVRSLEAHPPLSEAMCTAAWPISGTFSPHTGSFGSCHVVMYNGQSRNQNDMIFLFVSNFGGSIKSINHLWYIDHFWSSHDVINSVYVPSIFPMLSIPQTRKTPETKNLGAQKAWLDEAGFKCEHPGCHSPVKNTRFWLPKGDSKVILYHEYIAAIGFNALMKRWSSTRNAPCESKT